MIQVVRHDPSLSVRLAALERLTVYPDDPAIEETLLAVLEGEESVQMRLLAVDGLTRRQIEPRRLEEAIEAAQPEIETALKVRAGDYLQAL